MLLWWLTDRKLRPPFLRIDLADLATVTVTQSILLPSVHELHIFQNNRNIFDSESTVLSIAALSERLPNITHLDVSQCLVLSEKLVLEITQMKWRLHTLNVTNFDPCVLLTILLSPLCSGLQELYCEVDEQCLLTLINANVNTLKKLELGVIPTTAATTTDLVAQFCSINIQLEDLLLDAKLGREAMEHVATNCNKLTEVLLCSSGDDYEIFMSLRTHCPHIEVIDISRTRINFGKLANGERCFDVVLDDTDFNLFKRIVSRVDDLVLRSVDGLTAEPDAVLTKDVLNVITRGRICSLESFSCDFTRSDVGPDDVEMFLRFCPALKSLALMDIYDLVSNELFEKLPNLCPNLEVAESFRMTQSSKHCADTRPFPRISNA